MSLSTGVVEQKSSNYIYLWKVFQNDWSTSWFLLLTFFILLDPDWVHYQCVIFKCENFPSATSRWFIRVLLSFRTMMNINQHCSSGLDVLLGVSQLVPKSIDTTTSRDVKVGASQKLGWSWTGHKVFSDSWSKRHYHNSANTQTMTSLKVNFYG